MIIYPDYPSHLSAVQIAPAKVNGESVNKNDHIIVFWSLLLINILKWIPALQILKSVVN